MKSRPIPIVVAILYFALVCVYALTKVPSALRTGAFGGGQIIGLLLAATALTLLLAKPSIGRWFALVFLVLGAIYCALILVIAIGHNVGGWHVWLLGALIAFFLILSFFLAFGSSTRKYVASLRT